GFFPTLDAILRASAIEPHVTSTIRFCFPATIMPSRMKQTRCVEPFALLSSDSGLEYCAMSSSPIKFGTSGWRGLIADDFTFANVRLAVTAIANHANDHKKNSTILVGYDTRFYSEEFSQLAVDILQQNHIRTLLCETFTPTPAIAYEITRRKLDGAI